MKKRMLVIAAAVATSMMMASPVMADDFKVGICNYVDDASLNQIVDNIQSRLEEIGEEKGITFDVSYDNCNADASVMEQIISDFQADTVDLMVGVATPVAMRMQSATEGTDTPVVFSAVSDPVGSGLVDSLEAPGANITGTSDYLDTSSIMKLIQAQNPDATILVVSHGIFIRDMLTRVGGFSYDDFWKLPVGNCSIAVLSYDGKQLKIEEMGEKVTEWLV